MTIKDSAEEERLRELIASWSREVQPYVVSAHG
jgi:hypothetical protein